MRGLDRNSIAHSELSMQPSVLRHAVSTSLALAALGLLPIQRTLAQEVALAAAPVEQSRSAAANVDSGPLDEVVVYGAGVQQERAIDRKRENKQISDVIGSDALGKLPESNVAESAARLPGLNVIRDQQTGEGAYLSIRGLDATLNSYSINGVRMGQSGGNRAMRMQVLPPDGVKSIEVSKTLTPEMDGDALGGAVNIELPNAFDYDGAHLSTSVDGTYHERSGRNGNTVSLAASNLFGDNLGVYVGAYYGSRKSVAEETENEGDWMPYRWVPDGNEYLDSKSYMMQGLGLDLFENELERYGANFSVDLKYGDDNSFHVRGQHNRYRDEETHNYFDVRTHTSARLVQADTDRTDLANPLSMVIGQDATLGRIYGFSAADIVDADGDGRITDADRTGSGFYSMIGRSGTWDPEGVRLGRGVEYGIEEETQSTFSIGGENRFGAWLVDYDIAYARARSETPEIYGLDAGFSQSSPWLGNRGIVFSFPDPRYPQWQFNQAGFNGLYDLSNYPIAGAWAEREEAENEQQSVQFNVTRAFDAGAFQSLKFGGKYTTSERDSRSGTLASLDAIDGLTLAQSGLGGRNYSDFFDGEYSGSHAFGNVLSARGVVDAIRSCNPSIFVIENGACGFDAQAIASDSRVQLEEDVTAAYLMGTWRFGNVEVIGGVRAERTELQSTTYRQVDLPQDALATLPPEQLPRNGYISQTHSYNNVLPSLHLSWFANDNTIVRGAVWTSFTRPEYAYIAGGEQSSYEVLRDAGGNVTGVRLASINRSNLDLDPQRALNFDLSYEYYLNDKDGMLSAALYHKRIKDFLVVDASLERGVTDDQGVQITEPKNLDSARLTGIELGYTQRFRFLPAPFDGLGLVANLTLQDSEGDPAAEWRTDRPSFINAPDRMWNLIGFYEKGGWETRLSIQHTGMYIEDPRANGVDKYIQPTTFVDFSLSKLFPQQKVRMFVEVTNLTEEHLYWATHGRAESFQKDYVEAGRMYNVGFSWVF